MNTSKSMCGTCVHMCVCMHVHVRMYICVHVDFYSFIALDVYNFVGCTKVVASWRRMTPV